MKKVLIVAALAAAPLFAHATQPDWVSIHMQNGMHNFIDRNSLKKLPDGSVAFWTRAVYDRVQPGGMQIAEQHNIVGCNDAAFYIADAFIARDTNGNVVQSNAKRQEFALSRGSIFEAQVETVCAAVAKW